MDINTEAGRASFLQEVRYLRDRRIKLTVERDEKRTQAVQVEEERKLSFPVGGSEWSRLRETELALTARVAELNREIQQVYDTAGKIFLGEAVPEEGREDVR